MQVFIHFLLLDMAEKQKYIEQGDRLLKFIDVNFDGYQNRFADAIGMHASNLSKYVKGEKMFSTRKSQLQLREVGLNPEWYQTGKGSMAYSKEEEISNRRGGLARIKVYETPVHALKGNLITGLEDLSLTFIDTIIQEHYLNPDKIFGLYVSGDSMRGEGILDGSLILASSQIDYTDGSLVVVNVNGCIMLKLYENGKIYSVPDYGVKEEIKEFTDDNTMVLGVLFEIRSKR